jgi:hypothetical protein
MEHPDPVFRVRRVIIAMVGSPWIDPGQSGLQFPVRPKEDLAMHVDGSCLCGAITFDADIDPDKVRICHCTDCQNQTGSAYRTNVPAQREAFRLTSGSPKIWVKTAASGSKRAQAFCAECGSSIYSTAADGSTGYMLRVGTLRQRALLSPKVQQWCRSALPWAQDIRTLNQFPVQQPV